MERLRWSARGPRPAADVYPAPEASAPAVDVTRAPDVPSERGADMRSPRRNWTWAQLMARAFEVDVLCCARCGGRLRLIAIILDPQAIRALLRSLGPPTETPDRAPPGASRG